LAQSQRTRPARPGPWLLAAAALTLAACASPPAGTPLPIVQAGQPVGLEVEAPARGTTLGAGESPYGWFLAGRHAEVQRDYASATRYLSRVLDVAPENDSVRRRTLTNMVSDGRVAAAVPIARKVVAAKPDHTVANLVLAADALKRGDGQAAERYLDNLPSSGANRLLVPILDAWVCAADDDLAGAAASLAPLDESGGFPVLHDLHLGLIAEQVGDPALAEESYTSALGAAEGAPLRVAQAAASFYSRSGRLAEAQAVLDEAMAGSPGQLLVEAAAARLAAGQPLEPLAASATDGMAEAFFDLANALHSQGASRSALAYVQIALDLRPDFQVALLLLGEIYENQRQFERAIAVYGQIDSATAAGWLARLREADSLDSLDRVDDAVGLLELLATEQPTRHDSLTALGDLLRRHERFAEAADAYDRALTRVASLDAQHWRLLYSRGIARERTGAWEGAEADFLQALDFQPDQPFVLNYLGYSWVEQGRRLDEARAMIERAVELRPRNGYIVDSLGWVLYRMGDYDAAVGHLERAVELQPVDPIINDHLGDAYYSVGRRAEARFQWRRALSFEPNADLATELEDKLSGRTKPERLPPGSPEL